MATTTEYALLLLAELLYNNVLAKYLDITKDSFILRDIERRELVRITRNPGSQITTQRFDGLSCGVSLSFLPGDSRLFALSGDDMGAKEIECQNY
jgi:hypothetical protein